jgi:hypothetical protein
MDSDLERDARRYRVLRDYLLLHRYVEHVKLAADESEPFVVGATFYGPTFGDAVDSLENTAEAGKPS